MASSVGRSVAKDQRRAVKPEPGHSERPPTKPAVNEFAYQPPTERRAAIVPPQAQDAAKES